MQRTTKVLDGATATGASTEMNCFNAGTMVFQVVGTFTATITFQASINGSNWVAVRAENLNDGNKATTATAAGLYRIDEPTGMIVRANVTSYTSGTIDIWARGSAN